MGEGVQERRQTYDTRWLLLFTFVLAGAMLLICSKSSPLYPMNDWEDVNVFMSVAKAMLEGKVLYVDIFDQKGPLLYFVYALAFLLTPHSYAGVYLLEVLCFWQFLYWNARILMLYGQKTAFVWAALPILSLMVLTSFSFRYGGSVEELCLPVLSYALYAVLSALQKDAFLRPWEVLVLGVLGGAILWSKYTVLGLYVGLVGFVIVWQGVLRRDWRGLVKTVLLFLGGVLLISLPIFVYFLWNGAFGTLFYVYFYQNIVSYGGTGNTIGDVLLLLAELCLKDTPFMLCGIAGLVWAFLQKGGARLVLLFTQVTTFLLSCCLASYYEYYRLPLFAFSVFGLIALAQLFSLERVRAIAGKPLTLLLFAAACIVGEVLLELVGRSSSFWLPTLRGSFLKTVFLLWAVLLTQACRLPWKRWLLRGALALQGVIMLVLGYVVSDNTYLMFCPREEMPQYQFAEIINQKEDASLLGYGPGSLDGGFFWAAGIAPQVKYFCTYNIVTDEIAQTMDSYVEEGRVDFVLTTDRMLSELDVDSQKYELVAESEDWYFSLQFHKYYLYQLKD